MAGPWRPAGADVAAGDRPGDSDGSGRFRLDVPRVSSARHYTFGAVAIAPGYGAGWVPLDPDADQPAAEITLRPEQKIQGRIFDVQGRPVRGVAVAVETMATVAAGNGEPDGPYFLPDQPATLPAWPRPATSDAEGRFAIRGVGRGLRARLAIDDPRFARLGLDVDTNELVDTKNLKIAVEPARVITGRMTYADTGEPAPHAIVGISIITDKFSAWAGDYETDAQGRFRANPGATKRYSVGVIPPERRPICAPQKLSEWPRGAVAAFRGPGAAPRRARPRHGDRGRFRQADRGGADQLSLQSGQGPGLGRLEQPRGDRRGWLLCSSGSSPPRAISRSLAPAKTYVLQEIGQRMAPRASRAGGGCMPTPSTSWS